MEDHNEQLLAPQSRLQLVDTYQAHMSAQQPKIVFENFIFHPIKISLTFLHTDFPRHRRHSSRASMSSAALHMLTSVVEVELMAIKLNSFIVSNAVESVGSLLARIEGKVLQDLKGQLAQMAGSLTILGSPVGLARNIGTGVEAFFYEPYQGLVLGPQDFVRGLGRGTSSLVAGFVSGTLNSTAALVSTASSGISYLSGDADFVRDRSFKMQKLHASRSGALEGLRGGGDLVVKGFTSGLSGLFCQPFEGAQSSGAGGFVKGLGLGVAGAIVKPTLGLADGFSSAATGISNEVGFTAQVQRARPARALQRSRTDPSVRVLTVVDMAAAAAQDVVRTYHEGDQLLPQQEKLSAAAVSDVYIANFKLDNNVGVILSELKIMIFHQEKLIRVHYWSEVSHCFFSPDYVGVLLYSSKRSSNPIKIYFKTKQRGVDLYKGLLHHAYLMGNPPGTLPLSRSDEDASSASSAATTLPTTSTTTTAAANSAASVSAATSVTSRSSSSTTTTTTVSSTASALTPTPNSDSVSLADPSARYKFGSAKIDKSDLVVCIEGKLLMTACSRILWLKTESVKEKSNGEMSLSDDALFEKMDKTATWVVHSYVLSCNKFSRSRCCLVVVLNTSPRAVTVLSAELMKGRAMYSVGDRGGANSDGDGDADGDARDNSVTHSLAANNGYALFLGCGCPPSFYERGAVELALTTSAFDAVLCTDVKKSTLSEGKGRSSGSGSSGESRVGFIEKSSLEWWSKYCILIS